MLTINTIHAKDQQRTDIAEAMAAFEAANGPVATLPIYVGDRPKQTFFINVPGKPAFKEPVRKPRKTAAERKQRANILEKQKRLAAIAELAITGISIDEICQRIDPALGMSRRYIANAIWNHKLPRRPSTDLEG